MTIDQAAVYAVRDAIERAPGYLDTEATATLAVATLLGLGWTPPAVRRGVL